MKLLNNIQNNALIKINDNCDFCYLEENLKIDSPVNEYYYKYSDLSINLSIRLKWSLHAYYFMISIMETIDDPSYTDGIDFKSSINGEFLLKEKKIFTMDEVEITDVGVFIKEMEGEYSKNFYSENSIIHFKLKVNYNEFILLQNVLIPQLVYYDNSL